MSSHDEGTAQETTIMSEETFSERMIRVQRLTPDCTYRVDWGLARIPQFLVQYHIDMDPDYQRGYVWTKKQKQLFVGSAIQNHNAIPIFWFNFGPGGINCVGADVVDGKQRLTATVEWLCGKFEAICPCGETFHYHDCDDIAIRGLKMNTTFKMHFTTLDRLGVLKHYLSLNAGGTVHKPKDLEKVRELIRELEGYGPTTERIS